MYVCEFVGVFDNKMFIDVTEWWSYGVSANFLQHSQMDAGNSQQVYNILMNWLEQLPALCRQRQ